MSKRVQNIIVCIICLALMAAAAVTVAAVGTDTSKGSGSSSSDAGQTESNISSQTASSKDSASSKSNTSSEEPKNEEPKEDKPVSTSSASTSSKHSNYVGSNGAGNGPTFREEDPVDSVFSSSQTIESQVSSADSTSSDQYAEHYSDTKITSYGDTFKRLIIIPIVISLICLGALVYVNLVYKKKFPPQSRGAKRRRHSRPAGQSSTRRRR